MTNLNPTLVHSCVSLRGMFFSRERKSTRCGHWSTLPLPAPHLPRRAVTYPLDSNGRSLLRAVADRVFFFCVSDMEISGQTTREPCSPLGCDPRIGGRWSQPTYDVPCRELCEAPVRNIPCWIRRFVSISYHSGPLSIAECTHVQALSPSPRSFLSPTFISSIYTNLLLHFAAFHF